MSMFQPFVTVIGELSTLENCVASDMCKNAASTYNDTALLKLIHTAAYRHDKTVLSVSRPLRRCELDSRQLKTVADRKSEVSTRSE